MDQLTADRLKWHQVGVTQTLIELTGMVATTVPAWLVPDSFGTASTTSHAD